jgi:hypothetical protein
MEAHIESRRSELSEPDMPDRLGKLAFATPPLLDCLAFRPPSPGAVSRAISANPVVESHHRIAKTSFMVEQVGEGNVLSREMWGSRERGTAPILG